WNRPLGDFCSAQKVEQDLEALCVLYVALTRAKEATFVILNKEKPRRASPARDWILSAVDTSDEVASEQAAEVPWGEGELQWEQGSRDFGAEGKAPHVTAVGTQPVLQLPLPMPRRKRRRPSDAGHESFTQRPTAAGSIGGQEFGTAVHEAFEQIEWWTPDQALEGDKDAVALVRKCLALSDMRALFTREKERDEALRELPVEFMEKDTWWSGVIDRLVLRRDAAGGLCKAVLIDFKTDRVENAAALRDRYSEQLAIYHRAISSALKLADHQVEVVLLSTHFGELLQL
ncbi:MAG: PD-(D/E)XK nuclease family protein, partial [Verrucomicrobia bacterium]|nr:PD-(D/E)XK nuclease family protein [Verrucomicrobiota bacterium]